MRHHILPASLAAVMGAPAALADAPRTVTDIAPTAALASALMSGAGTASALLAPGADPHHFQIRPSQARELTQAELIFWISPDLTPWFAEALPLAKGATSIALAEATAGEENAAHDDEEHDEAHEGDEHAEDHDEHDDHDDHDDHDEHDDAHDHAHETDPHIWLDPDRAIDMAHHMAEALIAADPQNTETYADNLRRFTAQAEAQHGAITARLAPLSQARIITYHAAYDIFAEAFGLTIAATMTDGSASTPGAAQLSEVDAMLRDGAPACLIVEPPQLEAITRKYDAPHLRILAVDPTGGTIPTGPDAYGQILDTVAAGFEACAE